MPAKRRDFEKAALKKGFREIRKGTHVFYRYTDSKGEVYDRVHTMVSHGSGYSDLSDALISKMSKQLLFDKKKDFEEFIECTYSEKKYRDHLRKEGHDV